LQRAGCDKDFRMPSCHLLQRACTLCRYGRVTRSGDTENENESM